MGTRREFIRSCLLWLGGIGLADRFFYKNEVSALTDNKREVIEAGADPKELVLRNPKDIDASRLEPTPLEDFGTMGLEDHETDLSSWKLIVDGDVAEPLSLSLKEVKSLPTVERKVLLICPGVFINQGLWKGVDITELLKRAKVDTAVKRVTIRGPAGPYEKVLSVPIDDVRAGKTLLAYEVNGSPLPIKHGFPLRLAVKDYYGYDWIKYVYKVTAHKVGS
jgi:sulfoxide reductase catalytic subunit YedY